VLSTENRGEQTAAALEANLSSLESKLDALLASFGGGDMPPELLEEEQEEEEQQQQQQQGKLRKNNENGQHESDKAQGSNARSKEEGKPVPEEGMEKVEK